jgi:hypothetical protein
MPSLDSGAAPKKALRRPLGLHLSPAINLIGTRHYRCDLVCWLLWRIAPCGQPVGLDFSSTPFVDRIAVQSERLCQHLLSIGTSITIGR